MQRPDSSLFTLVLSYVLTVSVQVHKFFIVQQNVYGKYELQIINKNLWKNARKKTLQTDDWLI